VPIVSVGTRPPSAIEELANDDAFGLSFYNTLDDGDRSAAFMQAMGHPFLRATDEEKADARAHAVTMPPWPAQGAVALLDGIAVVKFADPTEP
jgi:hypothetical protein